MPVRATKRGAQRTRLERDCDVLVCGASFAGLAVARELAGSGAKVLMIDRYEIGERQTSACAMPTDWLRGARADGLAAPELRRAASSTRPTARARWTLPWSFSTFDYRELCALLWAQAAIAELEFETATVTGREGCTVHTDRGELRAPLIVDALGWRRVLSNATPIQPPNARLSRGLEVHPHGSGEEMELWIDPRYVRAGYGWSFPARRRAARRRRLVLARPPRQGADRAARRATSSCRRSGYQGNWIPHQLRAAVEDGVFFAATPPGTACR